MIAPRIYLHRAETGLVARSRVAQEALAKYAIGDTLEVTIKKRRSDRQNHYYWAGLAVLIDSGASGFPTTALMHDAIKLDLGYVTPVKDLRGNITFVPNSTAFKKMDGQEFAAFFERARQRVIETYGFDPWAELSKEMAA